MTATGITNYQATKPAEVNVVMDAGAGRGLHHVLAKFSSRIFANQLIASPQLNLANLAGAKTSRILNSNLDDVNAQWHSSTAIGGVAAQRSLLPEPTTLSR
ncbi:hypothetical protein H9K75_13025 [Diaphorobacter aerolatus]|uniref:Uncharacterized protein n=1 Tax=Diaphorobacter aerolatus TaxID=1288495 RepID=A0A7H0GG73_9BURK|nr:hypothetical protein H9K75_13025 [Diaphorobacter aerolatus]